MKYKKRIKRFLSSACVCSLVIICLAIPAYAADSSGYMDQMVDKVWSWYTLIRNTIALPLLTINYASCGLQLLGSVFFSAPANKDQVKKKVVQGTFALIILFFLPLIIMAVKDLLQSSGWQPPTPPPLSTLPPSEV